jgi:hypothetical protein
MEKKESQNKKETGPKPPQPRIKAGVSGFANSVFSIIKLILGVGLLPFVYSSSIAFLTEFALIPKPLQNYFWSGVIVFLAVYLFIWEPAIIYAKGQRILEVLFNFFKPLVKVAPFLLPVYAIILIAVYGVLSITVGSGWLLEYTIFLIGFSITLHLVFSAKTMRTKNDDTLKSNYIFGYSFIYIINLALLAFCLSTIFQNFSFVNFCNNLFLTGKNIIIAVFKQLFVV